jgi:hypothetical protein
MEQALAAAEFNHYFTDARSLRFTNIDVRVILEVWEGEVCDVIYVSSTC